MHKIHKNSKILTNERRVPGKKKPNVTYYSHFRSPSEKRLISKTNYVLPSFIHEWPPFLPSEQSLQHTGSQLNSLIDRYFMLNPLPLRQKVSKWLQHTKCFGSLAALSARRCRLHCIIGLYPLSLHILCILSMKYFPQPSGGVPVCWAGNREFKPRLDHHQLVSKKMLGSCPFSAQFSTRHWTVTLK